MQMMARLFLLARRAPYPSTARKTRSPKRGTKHAKTRVARNARSRRTSRNEKEWRTASSIGLWTISDDASYGKSPNSSCSGDRLLHSELYGNVGVGRAGGAAATPYWKCCCERDARPACKHLVYTSGGERLAHGRKSSTKIRAGTLVATPAQFADPRPASALPCHSSSRFSYGTKSLQIMDGSLGCFGNHLEPSLRSASWE